MTVNSRCRVKYERYIFKTVEIMNEAIQQQETQGNGVLPCVSERYLLIEWIQGHPVIDGAKYADTKQEIMDYYNSLPKLPKSLVEYTICRIYNVR